MADDVQPRNPPEALLEASREVVPGWLRRITADVVRRSGLDEAALADELDAVAEHAAADVLDRLAELMDTDVDEQRTTPLTLFRDGVREPTAWLRSHGVQPPPAGPADGHFPDDVYRLGPATWADIDPALHEPGLMWGAWKAMTVLARRRDDGLR